MNLALRQIFEKADKRKIIRDICSVYIPVLLFSLLFIVPLTDSSKMFNGIVSAKKYYFYLFMLIIIVYNSILFIYEKRFNRIVLNKIDIAFLLYAGWNLVSAIITNDSYINDKTGELVMLVAYYFIIKMYLSETDRFGTFMNITSAVLLIVGIIESVVGLLQVYEVIPSNSIYFRVTGTFYNPAPYALLLSVIFSFSLSVSVFHKGFHILTRYLSYIACFLILNVIPFTYNRASWLGIVAGILLVLYYYLDTRGFIARLSRWTKAGILFLILISGIAGLVLLYNLKEDSSRGRLLIWKVSSNIIKDHPLTGIGYGRFRSEYNLYQADYFRNNHNQDEEMLADDVQLAFNDYLETIVETGIIGVGFLGFLIISVFLVLKYPIKTIIIYLIPFVIILILALITYPVNSLTTKILFFFLVALVSREASYITYHLPIPKVIYISLLIGATLCIPLMVMQINKYQKYKVWLYATKAYENGYYSVSEDYFRQIYESLRFERFHSVMYADCLMQNMKYNEVIDILSKTRMVCPNYDLLILMGNGYRSINEYSDAEFNYREANYMEPGKILPEYLLIKLYYETGKTGKADSIADAISNTRIKIKSDSTQKLLKEIKILYQKNKEISRLNMPDRGI